MKSNLVIKIDPDLKDIVPEFLQKRRDDVLILRNSLDAKQYQDLQMMGHRLKSNSTSYGFTYLAELGKKLETAALTENFEKAELIIEEIADFLNNVRLEE